MRLANVEHTSRPWRIHDLTRDFRLEDVWGLPVPGGGPDDFPKLVQQFVSRDPVRSFNHPALRALFAIRFKLGALFGWDDPVPASTKATLRDRLPADLRGAPGPDLGASAFHSLYLLHDEWAAEVVNKTVHGVVHLGWVPQESGGYRAQLAVLVQRKGLLGAAYMAAIKPFRHLIVYPLMTRELAASLDRTLG